MSRKGCAAAPAIFASSPTSRGRFAALSRRKAAPTKYAFYRGISAGACGKSTGPVWRYPGARQHPARSR
ncbi:hypothetical protein B7H18_03420 [Pseudomonas putida]|nr:hypothetical protein B7H18_03420 [Pseudomonas putida]